MKKKTYLILLSTLLLLIIFWTLWGNTAIELNQYTITNEKIPNSFNDYRIALVTDLHNDEMGEDNIKLIEILSKANPDMIAIVGDIVDCHDTNIHIAVNFATEATQIAPTYYVTGNHEAFIEEYTQLENSLISAGVTIMHNKSTELVKDGEFIHLIGVNDPSFTVDYFTGDSASALDSVLNELSLKNDTFKLLLSHRPELFDIYVKHDIDLILSGHAHGGQFRLPFLGGLYSPNQGLLPKYDAGLFTKNNTTMIVSRGIGNSAFPIRFNNRPEIILIKLQSSAT